MEIKKVLVFSVFLVLYLHMGVVISSQELCLEDFRGFIEAFHNVTTLHKFYEFQFVFGNNNKTTVVKLFYYFLFVFSTQLRATIASELFCSIL